MLQIAICPVKDYLCNLHVLIIERLDRLSYVAPDLKD